MIPEKVPRERSQYLSRPDVRVYLQKYPDESKEPLPKSPDDAYELPF